MNQELEKEEEERLEKERLEEEADEEWATWPNASASDRAILQAPLWDT